MSHRFQAVVFDLDGTLVDTAADIQAVLAEILGEAGMSGPPLAAVRGMVGDGARVLIARALAQLGQPADEALLDHLHARFVQRYAEVPCRASRAYPDVAAVLAGLKGRGIRLGLCTNKPQAAALGLLRALGLDGCFAAVVGGDRAPRHKPDPAHLAAVLERLGTPPAAAVMVGDSRNDVLIAHGLGLPCILVSFGYTAVPARDLGGEAVIDRLAELPAALAALSRRALTARGPVPS